jgi:hypothetical protein
MEISSFTAELGPRRKIFPPRNEDRRGWGRAGGEAELFDSKIFLTPDNFPSIAHVTWPLSKSDGKCDLLILCCARVAWADEIAESRSLSPTNTNSFPELDRDEGEASGRRFRRDRRVPTPGT